MIELITGEGENRSYTDIDIGQYSGGSFFTGTNCTTADRITFFVELPDGEDREAIDFLKLEE